VILGVAQLVFNVPDLDAAAAPLVAAGCEETFRATRLPNHPHKRPVQSDERAALDMAHFTPPAGVAIELTRYEGAPPAGATVYRHEDGGVTLTACDPAASVGLWAELGFGESGPGRLENRAMLPAWRLAMAIEPAAGERRPRTTVDADGCVLVTLLTTDLDKELARLLDTGFLLRSTAAWTEQIADRSPTVAIVEGPSGELIELLQAPRR
jgi:hypothetical protein